MKTLAKSLSFRYLKKADADLGSCKVLSTAEIRLKGDEMTILHLILLASHGLLAVLMYKTGFHDGQVEGRIEQFQKVNG
jgi:hypothetical protein